MNRVKIVGIGPGDIRYTLPIAQDAIHEAEVLVGSRRSLAAFSTEEKEVFYYDSNLAEMLDFIEDSSREKQVVVVVTGDSGFYSLLDVVKKRIGHEWIEAVPGISSFQYLFARLGRGYKDFRLMSLHGRETDFLETVRQGQGVFLLTDGKNTPAAVAQQLIAAGIDYIKMTVGENLSYQTERILSGSPMEIAKESFDILSVVVIEHG